MNTDALVKQFEKAGLELKILDKPIGSRSLRGMESIVQMDIKKTRKKEWFEIYPGAEGNEIQVVNVDDENRQVFLSVKEPEREFEVETRAGNKMIVTKRSTSGNIRHFLAGTDERHLFIAQLPESAVRGVSTVAGAKKALGSTVKGKAKRQGEWFFLETSQEIRDQIDEEVQKGKAILLNKQDIGTARWGRNRRGRPHVADEVVVMRTGQSWDKGTRFAGTVKVYIRGKVRHEEHKTHEYLHWMEVVENNEHRDVGGLKWID